MGKIAQKWNFLYVSQNSDLSLKVDSTHQNESRDMFIF